MIPIDALAQVAADGVGLKVRVLPAIEPFNMAAVMIRAHGIALVTFDSGRVEPRRWGATLMVSDVERGVKDLVIAKVANWIGGMLNYRDMTMRAGLQRPNRKGRRRFASLEWVRP